MSSHAFIANEIGKGVLRVSQKGLLAPEMIVEAEEDKAEVAAVALKEKIEDGVLPPIRVVEVKREENIQVGAGILMPKDSGDSPNLMKRTCEARAASPTLTQVAELLRPVLIQIEGLPLLHVA